MFEVMSNTLIDELIARVGADHVHTSQTIRETHAGDASRYERHMPEVVVSARTSKHVAAVLKLANEHHIPVTPWGAGTSLEGNAIPQHGGILLSLAQMDQVIALHEDDFQAVVQPGIKHMDFNEMVAPKGLLYPPGPGANASIGGLLANNAAGPRTVKYGAAKDNVLALEVALADGRLIRTGSRSIKQSSGYNLTQLFVGSEGTLGIITEATIRLVPLAKHMGAIVAAFDTVQDAVKTVVAIRKAGLDAAALEFVGAAFMEMLIRASRLDYEPAPTLFMEFHAAHPTSLDLEIEAARAICKGMGAGRINATTDPEEHKRLWKVRYDAYYISVENHPDMEIQLSDIAVPISRYPDLIAFIEAERERRGVTAYLIGHAGDGNIHLNMPYADEDGYQRATDLNHIITERAIAMGGTSAGEHGVGLGKRKYMESEHGPAVGVMRSLKDTLDPNGILNPGKIFPS